MRTGATDLFGSYGALTGGFRMFEVGDRVTLSSGIGIGTITAVNLGSDPYSRVPWEWQSDRVVVLWDGYGVGVTEWLSPIELSLVK